MGTPESPLLLYQPVAPRMVADTDRVLLSDLLVSIRKDLFYSFTLSHIHVVGIY